LPLSEEVLTMLSKTRSTPVHSPAPGVMPDTITAPIGDGSPTARDPDVDSAQASAATATVREKESSGYRAGSVQVGVDEVPRL
jgi:hypothetical protein